MSSDNSLTRHMVDAGLGGVSAVVSSLPAGYTLGEHRVVNNVEYRLVHNAGNSAINPGLFASAVPNAGSTANSVTVSTVSQSWNNFAAVLCVHATVPTANYFWGAIEGPGLKVTGDNTSVPTGSAFYISAAGQVTVQPASLQTGNYAIGVNMGGAASKTVTTGAASGDCYISLF